MGSFRHQRQSGFTLIELVIVIVIIGILAAVAIPKFSDLANEAKVAAVNGIAGNVATASSTNFVLCQAFPGDATKCTTTVSCSDTTGWKVLEGGKPIGAVMSGNDAACIVTKDATASSAFIYKAVP